MVAFSLKKYCSLSICIDYRKRNALTLIEGYVILRMDECMDWLAKVCVFLTSDDKSGYWPI